MYKQNLSKVILLIIQQVVTKATLLSLVVAVSDNNRAQARLANKQSAWLRSPLFAYAISCSRQ